MFKKKKTNQELVDSYVKLADALYKRTVKTDHENNEDASTLQPVELPEEVRGLVNDGARLKAIQLYMQSYGKTLCEAHELIQRYEKQH